MWSLAAARITLGYTLFTVARVPVAAASSAPFREQGQEKNSWGVCLVGEDQVGGSSRGMCAPVHMDRDLFVHEAEQGLRRRMPELSASKVITCAQHVALLVLAAALVVFAFLWPRIAFATLIAMSSLHFFLSTTFRGVLSLIGGSEPKARSPGPDDQLPIYTVLVPLYREARVIPSLAQALRSLAYPASKLDIKIIVEADDPETEAAARQLTDHAFHVIRVPPGQPKTKPRACNYALQFAAGEFTVIYDAEDRPESDQLRKAVEIFRSTDDDLACLQARLDLYNAEESWIARLFTLDYMVWFNSLLPGLGRLHVPMPLGGTSNHFRTSVLRELGGWDPFNVTEDADLGIRIAQLGKRVAMLDSTTFEEAPTQIGAWIKQRSRWLKGYMQTWLVHTRHPFALWRNVGWQGFFAFHLFIGGAIMSALLNPVLWIFCGLSFFFDWTVFGGPLGQDLLIVSGGSLVGGHAILTGLAVIGPLRRGLGNLAPYAFTVTLYWMLISIAAYRALHQLIVNPFHWDKTEHGLSKFSKP